MTSLGCWSLPPAGGGAGTQGQEAARDPPLRPLFPLSFPTQPLATNRSPAKYEVYFSLAWQMNCRGSMNNMLLIRRNKMLERDSRIRLISHPVEQHNTYIKSLKDVMYPISLRTCSLIHMPFIWKTELKQKKQRLRLLLIFSFFLQRKCSQIVLSSYSQIPRLSNAIQKSKL